MDFTHVKCQGQDRIVTVATAVLTGQPVAFELLESEGALHAERWIRSVAKRLGAEMLITDDADGLKNVAGANKGWGRGITRQRKCGKLLDVHPNTERSTVPDAVSIQVNGD